MVKFLVYLHSFLPLLAGPDSHPTPGCHSPALLRLALRRDLHVLRAESSSVQSRQLYRLVLPPVIVCKTGFCLSSRVPHRSHPDFQYSAISAPPVRAVDQNSGGRPYMTCYHQQVGGGVGLCSAHLLAIITPFYVKTALLLVILDVFKQPTSALAGLLYVN